MGGRGRCADLLYIHVDGHICCVYSKSKMTNTNLTADDIKGLRNAAATAGDHAMVLICDLHAGDVVLDEDTTIESLQIASFLSPIDLRRIAAMDADDLEAAVVEAIESGRAMDDSAARR